MDHESRRGNFAIRALAWLLKESLCSCAIFPLIVAAVTVFADPNAWLPKKSEAERLADRLGIDLHGADARGEFERLRARVVVREVPSDASARLRDRAPLPGLRGTATR